MRRSKRCSGLLIWAICPICALLSVADGGMAQDSGTVKTELAKALAEDELLQAKMARLEAALTAEIAAKQKTVAVTDATQKTLAVLRQEVEKLRQEVRQSQAEHDKMMKQIVEMTDRMRQAVNEAARLKAENERLVSRRWPHYHRATVPAQEGVVSGILEDGRVEISLGVNDGVVKSHFLNVHRVDAHKSVHLGYLVVVESSPDKSICRPGAWTAEGIFQKGDRVTTAYHRPPPGEPPNLVGGKVLSVGDTGEVEISFGSDDGLWPGHRLEVYRMAGNEGVYVGRVEVLKTSAKKSICKSLIEFEKKEVRKGDQIISKL